MNKQKFIEFVENPASITEKDADILAELARNYPYSSLVHTMLAKANQNTNQAQSSLANAALYIPDRSVLKSVMENNFKKTEPVENSTPVEAQNSSTETGFQKVATAPSNIRPVNEKTALEQEAEGGKDVFQELEDNLQKLKEQRERYQNPVPAEGEAEIIKLATLPPAPEKEEEKKFSLPERLQEVVESKEEKIISDPKRVEQIHLINSFIQNSSSITRKYRSVNDSPEEQTDLTKNYPFTPQDFVTENLAQIMVRQGKPEKAIDIYEKLILKYPQKNAYFASCIEKLKNS